MRIYKYEAPYFSYNSFEMPKGSRILKAAIINDKITIWVASQKERELNHYASDEMEIRAFVTMLTNISMSFNMEEVIYIDTLFSNAGPIHLFEHLIAPEQEYIDELPF